MQLLNSAGTVVQEAKYTYYSKNPGTNSSLSSAGYGTYGGNGDLQSVQIYTLGALTGGDYYRYDQSTLSTFATDAKGNPVPAPVFDTQHNLLTDAVTGSQFAILAQDLIASSGKPASDVQFPQGPQLDGISESGLQNTYDTVGFKWANGQVQDQYIQGAAASQGATGSSSSVPAAVGTLSYTYMSSYGPIGLNSWSTDTTVKDQLGNSTSYFFNHAGELMLQSFDNVSDPANGALSGDFWNTYYHYNSSGHMDLTANPSALTNGGYNIFNPDLVNFGGDSNAGISATSAYTNGASFGNYLSANAGVINISKYTSNGYLTGDYLQHGTGGSLIQQDAYTYTSTTASGGGTVYLLASSATYQQYGASGAYSPEVTTYGYGGPSGLLLATITPPSSSDIAGSGATLDITNFDAYGRPLTAVNALGMTTTYAYDDATGAVTQTVNSGDGVGITTSELVDPLGRPTQITDGNGNVTKISYADGLTFSEITTTVANSSGVQVGPTQVTYINYGLGFTDSYTLSGNTIESLTRTDVNAAGQTLSVEKYFNVVGLTPGSQSGGIDSSPTPMGTPETPADQIGANANYAAGNYYQTLYAYNQTGQQYQTTDALGTITQTNYDALGRPYQTLVGTNTGNLTVVATDIYDHNGAGDSNLTLSISDPGGVPPSYTTYFYNWRNQVIAENKSNIQLVVYNLDNLGEITQQQTYNASQAGFNPAFDAAGTVTTASPNGDNSGTLGLSSSALRAQTDTLYDARGNVSAVQVHDITPGTGYDAGYLQTTYQYL